MADQIDCRPRRSHSQAKGPERAVQTCRGSESGPDRLKVRCGRSSHTVDSDSGPGGLKAGTADQSHSRPKVHGCSVIRYVVACYACMVYVVGILGISH